MTRTRAERLSDGRHLGQGGYEPVAEGLGVTVGALRVAVHRARHRFAEILRAEVGETVSTPEEVQDEIHCLVASLDA